MKGLDEIEQQPTVTRKQVEKMQRFLVHLRRQKRGITDDEDRIVRILSEKPVE